MKRIEIHLTDEEAESVEKLAKEQGRSRKKQCEFYIREKIEKKEK